MYFLDAECGGQDEDKQAVECCFAFSNNCDGEEACIGIENSFDREEYKEKAVVAQCAIKNANSADGGSN